MKKHFFPEGRLNAILLIEQNNLFAERLRFAKPSIDSTCPKTFSIFRKDVPKSHEKGNLSNSSSKNIIL
jgi:hypothetical protein